VPVVTDIPKMPGKERDAPSLIGERVVGKIQFISVWLCVRINPMERWGGSVTVHVHVPACPNRLMFEVLIPV